MVAAIQQSGSLNPAESTSSEGFEDHEPANWTCYSAGEPVSEWVLRAAGNPATPIDVLCRLAESCNVDVRMAVADNTSAPLETVLMLAQDESVDLRYQIAENHNVHEDVLRLLCDDSNPYIAHRANKTIARLATGVAKVSACSCSSSCSRRSFCAAVWLTSD